MSDSSADADTPCDGISFEVWYRSQWGRLVGVLTVSTGDRALAEDLAAEAFAKALSRWDVLCERGEPTSWLYTVAFNDRKKRWRRLRGEQEAHAVVVAGELAVHEVPIPRPDLWDAVRGLPDRARLAVALRYVADLTEREVAELMGISRGTVASTLSDARRRLAQQLDDRTGAEERSGEERCRAGGSRTPESTPDELNECEVTS